MKKNCILISIFIFVLFSINAQDLTFYNDVNTTEAEEVYLSQKTRKRREPTRDNTYRHWISGEIGFLSHIDRISTYSPVRGDMGVNIGLQYEYVFTPKFSLNAGYYFYLSPIGYDNLSTATPYWPSRRKIYPIGYYDEVDTATYFNTGINVTPRWYPSARSFFIEIGLGYNLSVYSYSGSHTYDINNIKVYYEDTEGTSFGHAINIIPGIGWNIDIGKPGGFFITPGIRFGIVGSFESMIPFGVGLDIKFRSSIYCSFGYAF